MMKTHNKRRDKDVHKLVMSAYSVQLVEQKISEFIVKFKGPVGSAYEGGQWDVYVNLPQQYPYKSPSIGFMNRIFHPNIDYSSGSVCLDVINQTWSPMFDLINIFDVFLPQLLMYPNPADPMNGEAARLYVEDREAYERRVRDVVKKHAFLEEQNPSEIKSSQQEQPKKEKLEQKKLSEEEGEKEETGEDDEIMSVENNSLSDVSDLELEELSEDQNE